VCENSISSSRRKVSKRAHQKVNLRRSSAILHREHKECASELLEFKFQWKSDMTEYSGRCVKKC
jgi:hypothetical protein